MTCPQCNERLAEGDAFCGSCGAALMRPLSFGRAGQAVPAAAPPATGSLRHPKESAYFMVAAIAAVCAWLVFVWIALLLFWVVLPVAAALWIVDRLYRAQLLGNSIQVRPGQFPEICELVTTYCEKLRMYKVPEVFIVNGNGVVNAIAMRMLRDKYVLLLGDLVDVTLASGLPSLGFVLGHELGHHALGHTSPLRNLFLWPSKFVPFLGPAYARACELSADRVGLWLAGQSEAAMRGLAALACGSRALTTSVNVDVLKQQENAMSGVFAFLSTVFSTHPRITQRIVELEAFAVEKATW